MSLERDCCCRFAADYECSALPAVRAFEREVLGCDYGGTSWTTREQANHIASTLNLDADAELLEIGCGSGWPGLYLISRTGCRGVLVDLPFNALQQAAERARDDGIRSRVALACASGAALPFAHRSFSRLSHSDVLCCLAGKRGMLTECRRVAKEDALMHFSVIQPAEGISRPDYARVLESGPPFVEVSPAYESLLQDTGWTIEDRIDVSAAYGESLAKLAAGLAERPDLQEAYGVEAARAERRHRQDQLALVHSGLMQRLIFLVRAAGP